MHAAFRVKMQGRKSYIHWKYLGVCRAVMRFWITIYMQISKSACSSHCDLLMVQMGWIGFVVELSGFPPPVHSSSVIMESSYICRI